MASKWSGRSANVARVGALMAAFAIGWGVNAFVFAGDGASDGLNEVATVSTVTDVGPAAWAASTTTTSTIVIEKPLEPSDTAIPQLPTLPPLEGVSTTTVAPAENDRPEPTTTRPPATAPQTATTSTTRAKQTTTSAPPTTTTTTAAKPTTTTAAPTTTTTAKPTTTTTTTAPPTTTTTAPPATTTTAPPTTTTLAPLVDPVFEKASIESPVECIDGSGTTRISWETTNAVSVGLEADGAVVRSGLAPTGNSAIDFACQVGGRLRVAIVATGPASADGRSGATSRVADDVATVVAREPE